MKADLMSRLGPGLPESLLECAKCRYGEMIFVRTDDPVGRSLREFGEWAQVEIDLLRPLIHEGDTVLDVGANVGTHTLAFSAFVGASGSVHAFEPQGAIAAILKANCELNGIANVRVYVDAVGREAGVVGIPVVDFREPVNSGGVTLMADDGSLAAETVAVITLDSLALERCDLVKVDVEGMEEDVLVGMIDIVKRLRPPVLFECRTIAGGVPLLLADCWDAYSAFLIAPQAFNPDNFNGNRVNTFGHARESSLLFVPNERSSAHPVASDVCDVTPIEDLDTFAKALLRVPQYEDARAYQRFPERLAEELDSTEAALGKAEEEVRRFRFRSASLEASLYAAQDLATRVRMELGAAREQIANLNARIDSMNEHEYRLEAMRSDSAAEALRLSKDLAEIKASTSWRVSSPLRLLGRFIQWRRLVRSRRTGDSC